MCEALNHVHVLFFQISPSTPLSKNTASVFLESAQILQELNAKKGLSIQNNYWG